MKSGAVGVGSAVLPFRAPISFGHFHDLFLAPRLSSSPATTADVISEAVMLAHEVIDAGMERPPPAYANAAMHSNVVKS